MRAQTQLLDVEVAVAGPEDGPVILLLHGWPDDATTWNGIGPRLNAAGLRTVTPTLRGFGGTRFLSAKTPRTGNTGVLAHDAIELMDALGVERFEVAGHDWGSNMAEALAVGWPERVEKIAMISTPPRLGGMATPPFEQAQRQWYHWFQATERGAKAVEADPKGFAHIMWVNWAPEGWFKEATFETVARSFENPDFVPRDPALLQSALGRGRAGSAQRRTGSEGQSDEAALDPNPLSPRRGGRREPAARIGEDRRKVLWSV